MIDYQLTFTMIVFLLTVFFILWRPLGINEYIPTTIGACILFVAGIVPLADIFNIVDSVMGAAITILSTIVMSMVLESIGFFRYAAYNLAVRSRGSGVYLFWNINLLCLLMTLFFNNDGSILITTPIIIHTLSILKLKPHQKIPFLLSGALVATASSAPIGVSNLANLISLKIVGLDLNLYAQLMFVPSMIGIVVMTLLLYVYYRHEIPKKIPIPLHAYMLYQGRTYDSNSSQMFHPLAYKERSASIDWKLFGICIAIVVMIRISYFIFSPLGVPTEYPSIIGAIILIAIRWKYKKMGIKDIITKTPWYVLLFAFSMYVIVFGLYNTGLTTMIVQSFASFVASHSFHAIFFMGILLTFMSNIFNNLPSIMIGTLLITDMGLDTKSLQVAYLANVIGADIGALILPMGTLATLIWMYILKQNNIPFTWGQYVKVTILIIPITLIVTLLSLYLWTELIL